MSQTAPFSAYAELQPGKKFPYDGWEKTKPGQPKPARNYGIVMQPTELVIDVDYYKPEGKESYAKLCAACPELSETKVVRTQSGGFHFYGHLPAGTPTIKQKQDEYPGVEFQHVGRQVVGEGSVFPSGVYSVVVDKPVVTWSKSFIDSLERQEDRKLTLASIGASLSGEASFINECRTYPAAIQGSRGDDTTYKLGCVARDWGLPLESAFAAMRDYYNPRCQPAWSDTELRQKVMHSYEHAKNAFGVAAPQSVFTPPAAPLVITPHASNVTSIDDFQHDRVMDALYRKNVATEINKAGKTVPVKIMANVVHFLREHAAWKGKFLYNQFADQVEIKGRAPWRINQLNASVALNSLDIDLLKLWFSSCEEIRFELGVDVIKSACHAAATPYHPVLDYLNGLVWDGTPRLDTILPDTTGCEDSRYHRVLGAKTLIGAVKRIYEPGCKHDYVIVLESGQGTQKSSWVKALGGEWASSGELVPGDKDTFQNMRGKWVIELPEIQSTFGTRDHHWLKKIITTESDTYRASYGHRSGSVPRESVFIATLNPNATRQYLKDDENRRYWPVTTGVFDLAKLVANRDQYFAEAVHRYRAGEKNYIEDRALESEVKYQQSLRKEVHPWTELIAPWAALRPHGFTIVELYTLCLGMSGHQVSSTHIRTRVYGILKDLGYEYRAEVGAGSWKKRIKTWEELI